MKTMKNVYLTKVVFVGLVTNAMCVCIMCVCETEIRIIDMNLNLAKKKIGVLK